MSKKLKTKSGKIERVFFRKIGFSAGLMRDNNGKIEKFAGNLYAKEGRNLTICGHYARNKYGHQFIVKYVCPKFSMDIDGLIKYLALRPDIRGVGPSKAAKIVNNFGDQFENTLLSNPEKIVNFANLSNDSLRDLKFTWEYSKGWNQVYSWLASFDLTYYQIETLVKMFESECPFLLKEDPYRFIGEVKGFSFIKMDKIALKLGFDKKFKGRLLATLKYAVQIQLKNGHCWTNTHELQQTALRLLALDDDLETENIIKEAIIESISDGIFSVYTLKNKEEAIGLSYIAEYERSLSEYFINQGVNPHTSLFKNTSYPNDIFPIRNLNLNKMQQKAVRSALENNVSVISGGAGTGKTYTINAITRMCKTQKLLVRLAAPTGKAARRIEEVTGVRALTLHRLMKADGNYFEHEKNPNFEISSDVLIIDEVSMIDVELFWHLFQSLNLIKTSLVLVGDHNQLPPVGPGNVLRDLMTARPVAITVLTKVMRQAGTLKENSSAILESRIEKSMGGSEQAWYVEDYHYDHLQIKKRVLEMFDNYFENLGFHVLYDVQVLSPTHKGSIGTSQLNLDIRRIIQKKLFDVDIKKTTFDNHNDKQELKFYKHDKVIQTVNDYKNDVMNGEIGFITKINKSGDITVKFASNEKQIIFRNNSKGLSNIQLAYCLSIHKVQGSQFPCVVSIIHKSHNFMHHRNLLYTAVTRAEKTAMIIGDKKSIQNCANKIETTNRRTFLSFYMPSLAQI